MAKEAKVKDAKPQVPESMRPLTEAEHNELLRDDMPPADYANTTLNDPPKAPVDGEPQVEAPVEPPVTPPADVQPPAPPAPPTPPQAPDMLEKIETELAKGDGKEDLTSFSAREKAYFHQMRRDRKARQKAEEDRDLAMRKLHQARNPPPPPPDPLAGKSEDDVLTVKEYRELMAKNPPAAPKPDAPVTPTIAPTQAKYLALCEKEARAAHPEDFDAVMELSDDLLAGDAVALREIGEKVAAGENPAELMYEAVKKHKDFNDLFPAAQTRAKARLAAKAAPASPAPPPPASPSAPAVTPTPADQAKLDKAKEAQEALRENGNRSKTTAHAFGREGKPADDLTFEELHAMPDSEFRQLPRSVRQKYLKKLG